MTIGFDQDTANPLVGRKATGGNTLVHDSMEQGFPRETPNDYSRSS